MINFISEDLNRNEQVEMITLLAATLEGMSQSLETTLDFEQRMNFEKLVKSLRRKPSKKPSSA